MLRRIMGAGLLPLALCFTSILSVVALANAAEPVKDNTPVLIGLTPDTSFSLFYVAVDKGFLKAEGVNAAYRIGQGAEGTQAVMVGAEQMAPNSELPSLINKAKGGNYQSIAIALHAARQIGAAAIAAIKKPTDLYGRKVGVPFGTGGEYFFDRYVVHYHLDRAKISVLNVDASDMLPAIARGDIDAFFSWEPWLSKAATVRKGAHVLAYSGADGIYVMEYSLNVNSAFSAKHPRLVEATLRGLIRASEWIKKHPKEAAEVVGKAIRLPADQAEELLLRSTYPVEMTSANRQHFISVASWLRAHGKIAKSVNTEALVSGLFNPKFLKAVAPGAVTLGQ